MVNAQNIKIGHLPRSTLISRQPKTLIDIWTILQEGNTKAHYDNKVSLNFYPIRIDDDGYSNRVLLPFNI